MGITKNNYYTTEVVLAVLVWRIVDVYGIELANKVTNLEVLRITSKGRKVYML